jgi:hypothetical protein
MTALAHARSDMIMPRARCVGLRRRRNPYRRGEPVRLHPLIGRSVRIPAPGPTSSETATVAGFFTVARGLAAALTVARSSAAAAWRVARELA